MSQPAQVVFKPGPARAPVVTHEFRLSNPSTSNVRLALDGAMAQAVIPSYLTPSTRLLPSMPRATLTITNPTEGSTVYIGPDSTVNAANGYALSPGSRVVMGNIISEIWIASAGAATPLYYSTT